MQSIIKMTLSFQHFSNKINIIRYIRIFKALESRLMMKHKIFNVTQGKKLPGNYITS